MWESGYVNDPIDTPNKQQGALNGGGSGLDDDQTKCCMPVSLAHIDKFTRPDEGLVIHGKKIASFTTVAMIHEIIDQTPTRLHLRLDDGTKGSPIEAIYIITDGSSLPFEVKPGTYVRVYGHAKFQDSKPFVNPFRISPLIDINEITMHILEVIKEMMYLEQSAVSEKSNGAQQRLPQPTNGNTMTSMTANDPLGVPNLPTLHKHVLNYLREACKLSKERCVDIDKICADLRQFKREDITKSLHELCHEGHIWNGDTDEIWCV